MSTDPFVTRFASHAIHGRLQQVKQIALDLLPKAVGNPDVTLRLQRIIDGLEMGQARLSIVNARWVGTNAMAQLEPPSQELLSQLQRSTR